MRRAFFLIGILLSMMSVSVVAQELTTAQQQVFMSVTGKVMSPYCPGKLLSDCPSGKASELKSELRQKISQGATEGELLSYLEDQYGKSTIQSAPAVEGFGMVAWIAPGLFLLVGLYFFSRWLGKRRSAERINLQSNSQLDHEEILSAVAERAKKDLEL